MEESRMQEVETPVVDTYQEHTRHYMYDRRCSTCHTRRNIEIKEKVSHQYCRFCHGTLTYYAPDGPDSTTTEICPGVSDEYVESLT